MEKRSQYTVCSLIIYPLVISFILFFALFADQANSQNIETLQNKFSTYLIGPEDVLEISVWKNAELSRVVTVRPDGMISLPLIGDVRAGGRTPNELRDEIVSRFKKYQETVVASVIVQTVNSYKIFILGEVKSPGEYILKRKTSLLQAIAMAGGFTDFASKNGITVIREKGNEEQYIKIRFDDIIKGKKSKGNTNIILKHGDTILVPTKTIF